MEFFEKCDDVDDEMERDSCEIGVVKQKVTPRDFFASLLILLLERSFIPRATKLAYLEMVSVD